MKILNFLHGTESGGCFVFSAQIGWLSQDVSYSLFTVSDNNAFRPVGILEQRPKLEMIMPVVDNIPSLEAA